MMLGHAPVRPRSVAVAAVLLLDPEPPLRRLGLDVAGRVGRAHQERVGTGPLDTAEFAGRGAGLELRLRCRLALLVPARAHELALIGGAGVVNDGESEGDALAGPDLSLGAAGDLGVGSRRVTVQPHQEAPGCGAGVRLPGKENPSPGEHRDPTEAGEVPPSHRIGSEAVLAPRRVDRSIGKEAPNRGSVDPWPPHIARGNDLSVI